MCRHHRFVRRANAVQQLQYDDTIDEKMNSFSRQKEVFEFDLTVAECPTASKGG